MPAFLPEWSSHCQSLPREQHTCVSAASPWTCYSTPTLAVSSASPGSARTSGRRVGQCTCWSEPGEYQGVRSCLNCCRCCCHLDGLWFIVVMVGVGEGHQYRRPTMSTISLETVGDGRQLKEVVWQGHMWSTVPLANTYITYVHSSIFCKSMRMHSVNVVHVLVGFVCLRLDYRISSIRRHGYYFFWYLFLCGYYLLFRSQTSTTARGYVRAIQWRLLDAVSSTYSLSVLM